MNYIISDVYFSTYWCFHCSKHDQNPVCLALRKAYIRSMNICVLAINGVNHLHVPPPDLMLLDVKNKICSDSRCALRDHPDVNTWEYYSIIYVSPIGLEDFLVFILSIPFTDMSLQMDYYRVYTIPALHPEFKVQLSYELTRQYLAISAPDIYATIPTSYEIHHLSCSARSSMCSEYCNILSRKNEWCVHTLFIKNCELINTLLCRFSYLEFKPAIKHDTYMWVVSSLATGWYSNMLLGRDSSVNYCTSINSLCTLVIGMKALVLTSISPAKMALSSPIDTSIRCKFFIGCNAIKTWHIFGTWNFVPLKTLRPTKKGPSEYRNVWINSMALNHLSKWTWKIGEIIPWSVSSKAVLAGLVMCALLGCAALIFSLWCIRQLCS